MTAAGAELIRLDARAELTERAAAWFHEKWGLPAEEYRQSMARSRAAGTAVPRWYAALADGALVGGVGVIENDGHERTDLTPNLCALYVEPAFRGRGLAGALMDLACADLAAAGGRELYLVTEHTGFYERYGWTFLFCATCGRPAPREPCGFTPGRSDHRPPPGRAFHMQIGRTAHRAVLPILKRCVCHLLRQRPAQAAAGVGCVSLGGAAADHRLLSQAAPGLFAVGLPGAHPLAVPPAVGAE